MESTPRQTLGSFHDRTARCVPARVNMHRLTTLTGSTPVAMATSVCNERSRSGGSRWRIPCASRQASSKGLGQRARSSQVRDSGATWGAVIESKRSTAVPRFPPSPAR
jgi:hypothetical protein